MNPNCLTLGQDEFNAHMLQGVMEATRHPGETVQDTRTRCAAIAEIFRAFEATNPMEAMIACHCVSLRFMLDAAMRDAGAADLEPALVIRLRASALAIGKSLHLWMTHLAGLRARSEAGAAEVRKPAGKPDTKVSPPRPLSASVQVPPAGSGQPRPVVAQPVKSASPFVAGPPRTGPEPELAHLPAQSMKQGLLSSAALAQQAAAHVRPTVARSPPGR